LICLVLIVSLLLVLRIDLLFLTFGLELGLRLGRGRRHKLGDCLATPGRLGRRNLLSFLGGFLGGLGRLGGFGLVLGVDELLRVGDVAVAEVVVAEHFGRRDPALRAVSLGGEAGVFLGNLLLLLGLVARRLVLIGCLSLHVAPDAVSHLRLVAANLETVGLAELVQSTGGALGVDLVTGFAGGGVLDLLSLENFLGFLVLCLGDRVAVDLLVHHVQTLDGENGKRFLHRLVIQVVLGAELAGDGLDGSHFEGFV